MNRFAISTVSRRRLLTGAAATGVAGLAGLPPALARAPKQNVQAPAFYRFRLGDFEATVISDGVSTPAGEMTI